MKQYSWIALLGILMAFVSCGGDSVTGPQVVNIAGVWSGTGVDSSGPGIMTWDIQQSGGTISGTVTAATTQGTVTGHGTLSGQITGTTLAFTITISPGGFAPPFESCTATITGSAQVSGSSLQGTYGGTNSCTGSFSDGQLSLHK